MDLDEATKVAMQEYINVLGTKYQAAAESGEPCYIESAALRSACMMLAIATTRDITTSPYLNAQQLYNQARERGRTVMRAEDWRRELDLYETFQRRFWGA